MATALPSTSELGGKVSKYALGGITRPKQGWRGEVQVEDEMLALGSYFWVTTLTMTYRNEVQPSPTSPLWSSQTLISPWSLVFMLLTGCSVWPTNHLIETQQHCIYWKSTKLGLGRGAVHVGCTMFVGEKHLGTFDRDLSPERRIRLAVLEFWHNFSPLFHPWGYIFYSRAWKLLKEVPSVQRATSQSLEPYDLLSYSPNSSYSQICLLKPSFLRDHPLSYILHNLYPSLYIQAYVSQLGR